MPTKTPTDEIPTEVLEVLNTLLKEAGSDPSVLSLITETKMSAYRGPFAPPEIVKEYEQAFPGAGQWILDRTGGQVDHRHGLERLQVEGAERRMDTAQRNGFVIALIAIPSAVYVFVTTPSSIGAIVSLGIMAIGVGSPTAGQAFTRALRGWLKR